MVYIANGGSFPATVRDAGRSGPGLDLMRVEGPLPATQQPDDEVAIWLTYRITDCDAAPRGSWPVTATVDRPWGTMAVAVAPEPHWDYWQEKVVSAYCHP
jgi:hypothetical protein